MVALALLMAMLAGIVIMRDPVLRLGALSLAREWYDCLVHGEPPSAQPDIAAALQAAQSGSGQPPRQSAPRMRVIRPKAQVATQVRPHPDRPDTVPRPVTVAVIDSGVTATHRDIGPDNVLPGVDLVNPCGNGQQDVTGHGTAVAGVLLSSHHGAAPHVNVLPIRISLATGRHSSIASALGILVATQRGADIINMSYTAQRRRPSLLEWLAVRYAKSRGVALVAAAGNDPTKPAGYPAAFEEVLSVTAIDGRGDLSENAARTGHIDVAAPGARVLTLSADGSLRVASGTSLAAPLVSASLVHMLRADPSISPERAVATLRETNRPEPEGLAAHRFGTFNFAAALAGVCAISSACQLSAALYPSDDATEGLPIGDPARLPRPGEPR